LRDLHRGERHFFARLKYERVATRDGDGIHPERNHRGKIEWRDADANAERLADRLAINAARHVLQHFAHHERRHAEREFHNFDAALHVAAGFHERLSVLARVATHEFIEIFFEQHL